MLGKAAVVSVIASLVVVGWAGVRKARIETRADLLTAESLITQSVVSADDRVAAAHACVRALAGYTPADPTGPAAVAQLTTIIDSLHADARWEAADELLVAALTAIDGARAPFARLETERSTLSALRSRLAAEGAAAEEAAEAAANAVAEEAVSAATAASSSGEESGSIAATPTPGAQLGDEPAIVPSGLESGDER